MYISKFYGDLLLYLPAVLRIIGFPVTAVYKFYVFLIHLVTSITAYICFQKMFQKKEIALLASLAYVNAGYRIVNVYVRMAVGEYSAMLFLPIAALAVYRIYTDSGASRKRCRSNALLLAAGMTGLIGTHVLTTEMTCFFFATGLHPAMEKNFAETGSENLSVCSFGNSHPEPVFYRAVRGLLFSCRCKHPPQYG